MVLVLHFSRLLNGLFSGTPTMAENGPPQERPIKRAMNFVIELGSVIASRACTY